MLRLGATPLVDEEEGAQKAEEDVGALYMEEMSTVHRAAGATTVAMALVPSMRKMGGKV
jgi:hypothetical protein